MRCLPVIRPNRLHLISMNKPIIRPTILRLQPLHTDKPLRSKEEKPGQSRRNQIESSRKMGTKSKSESDVNAKWDACLDLTARRVVYSSLSGAFAGLLFFRSPVTRWASIAFGAGIGIGSAYTDCSRFFDASSSTSATLLAAPKSTTTETSVSQVAEEIHNEAA